MSDFAAALTAYADIKAVNRRVQFDLRNMKSMLLGDGLIEDSDSEDGYASSDCSIEFIDCAREMGMCALRRAGLMGTGLVSFLCSPCGAHEDPW